MTVLEPESGERTYEFAARLLKLAPAWGFFNETMMRAWPGESEDVVVRRWLSEPAGAAA